MRDYRVGLSTDYEMERRVLKNNPAGLNRTEVERVVGNQYTRLFRQQQDSKALSASKSTNAVDRSKGKKRRPRNKFKGKCFNCGKKGHRAGESRSAKNSENPEIRPPARRAKVRASAPFMGVRSTLRTSTVVCARVFRTGLANVRNEELRRV